MNHLFPAETESHGGTALFPGSLPQNETAAARAEKLVAFYIGSRLFALGARHVAEVLNPLPVTPLPGSPEWLLGISALREEILAIVDLRTMLGQTGEANEVRTRFIVLAADEAALPIAFPIDLLHEVVYLDGSAVRLPDIFAENSLVSGIADVESGRVHILDPDKIFSSLSIV